MGTLLRVDPKTEITDATMHINAPSVSETNGMTIRKMYHPSGAPVFTKNKQTRITLFTKTKKKRTDQITATFKRGDEAKAKAQKHKK